MSFVDSLTAFFERDPGYEGQLDDGTAQGRLHTVSQSVQHAFDILRNVEGVEDAPAQPLIAKNPFLNASAPQEQFDQAFENIVQETEAHDPRWAEKIAAESAAPEPVVEPVDTPYDKQAFVAKAEADLRKVFADNNPGAQQ